MIRRVFSDLASFKELRFHEGLNVLIADKSIGATERHTRNRTGKTSLIELMHFVMGANCEPASLFRTATLEKHTFGIEFDLTGSLTTVLRSGQRPSKIIVSSADSSSWPVHPTKDKTSGRPVISNVNWRTILGALMFGLKEGGDGDETGKGGPTFRSLFAYFVRRQQADAFAEPVKQAAMQQLGDQQVAISFLLGLDWTIPQQWQLVRDREKMLKELRRAAAGGVFGAVIGTTADLRTKLAVAEERVERLRESVSTFKVLPEYRELEEESTQLTRQLADLSDENTLDRQLLAHLQESMRAELPPPLTELERIYNEVGITLPGLTLRRFDDVRRFHDSVIENRRSYLAAEVSAAEKRIADHERQMGEHDSRRSHIMGILHAHGALDHFVKLQSELTRVEAEMEALRQQFMTAEQLEGEKTQLDLERNRLLLRLRQDFKEQARVLKDAIVAFEEISSTLYEQAGSFTISESSNGPEFQVRIQGEKSKGVKNMQIFCFDVMLMKLMAKRGLGPGFLVHDSHLFDGVDERQVGKALQVGAESAQRLGFQYVVTMNSDAIPKELPRGFVLENHILPVRLTDATEDGGLFGMRFD